MEEVMSRWDVPDAHKAGAWEVLAWLLVGIFVPVGTVYVALTLVGLL
jgi:hypothetical protein